MIKFLNQRFDRNTQRGKIKYTQHLMIHHIYTHDKYELSDTVTNTFTSLTVCWYFIGGNMLCLDNDGLFPAQRKITTIKKMCTDLLFHTGQENLF